MIQGRIIFCSEKGYLAAIYALASAWDSWAQRHNDEDRQRYEVPLKSALFDLRIVHRMERDVKLGIASEYQLMSLAGLTPDMGAGDA